MVRRPYVTTLIGIIAFLLASAGNSSAQSDWKAEWERTLGLAKKEGKVVVAASPSAELRQALEAVFGNRFPGIQLELLTGVSSNIARRITDEYKTGIKNVDVLLSGTTTPLGLAAIGGLLPVEPNMILPEVKDPRQWWGGHIWVDNIATNRFIYSFQAHLPFLIWYNTEAMKAEDVRSYDDLLNPKWKGKMGFRDPRLQGGGQSLWVYMGMVKGEAFSGNSRSRRSY
jgi:iron(III) transport system substrate-binding protein